MRSVCVRMRRRKGVNKGLFGLQVKIQIQLRRYSHDLASEHSLPGFEKDINLVPGGLPPAGVTSLADWVNRFKPDVP